MTNITFDDNLITGNDTIDTQHEELINRIQQFVAACESGDGKVKAIKMLDYLDEYSKSTGSAENMRSQIQDYIADATRAKLAEDKVKAENEVLRREAAALREQLEKMRNKEARREERAQQAAQQSAAEGEADKAE